MLMELSACDLGAAVSGGSSRGGGGVWRWAGGGTAATATVASEGGVLRVILF
jgi:hypothetical protein